MRFLLSLLLTISASASWMDTQFFYLVNEETAPLVALTTTKLHGIWHASSPYTSVQIGNSSGFLTNYCNGFTDPESPCGSIQNCEWIYTSRNETNDAYLFLTCRPVTNGITYIATNYSAGTPVVWLSNARNEWINGNIQSVVSTHVATFEDNSRAWIGTVIIEGTQVIAGDSESPVFLLNGDFVCAMADEGEGGVSIGLFAYPEGAQYRPTFSASVSALFNSDPDQ